MNRCYQCTKPTRREWLGGLGAWAALHALTRRGDAQVKMLEVQPRNTARQCVFINMNGAPSHLDTFDIKDAGWNPNDANLQQFAGGIVLNTMLFPKLSAHAADMCILRSVKSWEAAHERGQFYLQTSHPSNPAFEAETPHVGAVVSLELGGRGNMPPFLSLNGVVRGATFLGGEFEPFGPSVQADGLDILEHNYFGDASQARFNQKFALLQQLEAPFLANPPDQSMATHAEFYNSARGLMYDPVISNVFKFDNEDDARYGANQFGRSCIVARNAIQSDSGAAYITIQSHGWDTHQNMWDRAYMPNLYVLCNELDTAVGCLVEDLKAAGKLDETLIVMMGEFGRTPGDLNGVGGRDHHKDAMSALMMGGGVAGATIIGATDAEGAQVVEPGWSRGRPIYTEDITASIYSALGINWTKSITDTPSGRKFEYVPFSDTGEYTSVEEIFA